MDTNWKSSLDVTLAPLHQWKPEAILLPVGSGDNSADGDSYDLLPIIELPEDNSCGKYAIRYWLPETLPPAENRVMFYAMLRWACANSGFCVASRGFVKSHNKVYIQCTRANLYQERKKEDPKRIVRSKTSRPIEKEFQCTFHFPVFWCAESRQWFMRPGKGCATHCHHLRRDPDEIKASSQYLNDANVELAKQMFRSKAARGTVQAFVYERSQVLLSEQSLDYLQRLVTNPVVAANDSGTE